jgi:hypothetical protein
VSRIFRTSAQATAPGWLTWRCAVGPLPPADFAIGIYISRKSQTKGRVRSAPRGTPPRRVSSLWSIWRGGHSGADSLLWAAPVRLLWLTPTAPSYAVLRFPTRPRTSDYCGSGGEGSNPVPLPPPAYPRPSVLRTNSWQLSPTAAAISNLSSGLPTGRTPYYSPKDPFLSGSLDFTHSLRFSKFDCFELLMNLSGKWFGRFSRIGDNVRFPN